MNLLCLKLGMVKKAKRNISNQQNGHESLLGESLIDGKKCSIITCSTSKV
jgi:hypothetical protein